MKKIICLLVMSLFLVLLVNAQEETPETADLFSKIEDAVRPFVGEEIPPPFGSLYGNEVINVYLTDEIPIGYAKTIDGVFAEIGPGEAEEPTMNVYVENGDTIGSIMQAENPLDKFYELKGDGKIKIDPVGIGSNVKYFFTNIIGKITSWFS